LGTEKSRFPSGRCVGIDTGTASAPLQDSVSGVLQKPDSKPDRNLGASLPYSSGGRALLHLSTVHGPSRYSAPRCCNDPNVSSPGPPPFSSTPQPLSCRAHHVCPCRILTHRPEGNLLFSVPPTTSVLRTPLNIAREFLCRLLSIEHSVAAPPSRCAAIERQLLDRAVPLSPSAAADIFVLNTCIRSPPLPTPEARAHSTVSPPTLQSPHRHRLYAQRAPEEMSPRPA